MEKNMENGMETGYVWALSFNIMNTIQLLLGRGRTQCRGLNTCQYLLRSI